MKNFITFFLLALYLPTVDAGFIVRSDPNNINMNQCNANHYSILKQYADTLDKQIVTLAKGIDFEIVSGSPADKVAAYKAYLPRLVVERIIVDQMIKQLVAVNFEVNYGKKAKPEDRIKKVFSYEYSDSLEIKSSFEFVREHIIHTYVDEIPSTIWMELKSEGLAGIFGNVLKGAFIGTVLKLATGPLKGGRASPINIWLDILEEQPGAIINPEWMNRLGSPDHPWETHCAAIQERVLKMEEHLERFIKSKEAEFHRELISINQRWDQPVSTKDETLLYLEKNDATKVNMNLPININLPVWANGSYKNL